MKKFGLQIVLMLALVIVLLLALITPGHAASFSQTTEPPTATDWSSLLSSVVQAVALIVLPFLAKYALAWMDAQRKYLEQQARAYAPDVMDALAEAARMAVGAAEQSKLAGLIKDKKEYAIDVVEMWLAEKGFDPKLIDLHLIEAEIERQVGLQFPKPTNPPTGEGASPAELKQK